MKESKSMREVSQGVAPVPLRHGGVPVPGISTPNPEIAAVALRQSEGRFRGLIETLPVAFYLCDAQGRIVLFNRSAELLWGRKPRIGIDVWCGSWRIFRPDLSELPAEECPMAVTLREGRSIRGEEIVVARSDGSRSWVLPHPDPIFDDTGAIAGAVNVLVDITPQRETELELREAHAELERRVSDRTAELCRVNAALEASEAFARSALDALRANICVLDEKGTIIAVNRAWRDFAGANLPSSDRATGDSFLGQNYLEICDAAEGNADAAIFAKGIRAVIAGEQEEFAHEYPCFSSHEKRWFNGRVSVFRDSNPVKVIIAHSDITERREAGEALLRAHESLSLAQRASDSGAWDWDAKTNELFVTPEFRKLFGLSDDAQITWATWMEMMHPDDRPRITQTMKCLLESGRDSHFEYRLVANGEEERWIEATGKLTRDKEGRPSRFTGISVDISARKRAEARIQFKADMLRLAHDAIHVWDAAGTVQYWNKGCVDLYGYESHEALGQPLHKLLRTQFPFPQAFVEDELMRTGRWSGELHQVTKNGAQVIVSSRLQLISRGENSTVTLGTHRDVTQQKRLEQGILDATMREQQRIAEDLHDSIYQELAGTDVLTRVLKIKIGPNAAALADLEKISSNLRQTIEHTRMLVQGLSPVNLGAKGFMSAIEELADRTKELFRVDCRYERERSVLVPDNARATHLYRITQEAISNAIRHGKAQQIRIRLTQTGDTAILAIHDDGVGLPQEVASAGGMGLHTMRHRAETIGGTLEVRRGGVKGTAVVCTFKPNVEKG